MRRVFQRDGLRRALPEEPLSRQPALLQSMFQAARRALGVPGNIASMQGLCRLHSKWNKVHSKKVQVSLTQTEVC